MLWTICGVVALTLAQTNAPDPAELKPTVARLVEQLDGASLAEREAAESELLKLGPAVLDLLPADTKKLSAEVIQRLERIRQTLQLSRAESFVSGSTVTLERGKRPLSEVLRTFEEQTGNHIQDYREEYGQPMTDPDVTVDFDKSPFWKALDDVLDQAGLSIYGFSGEPGIFLVNRGMNESPRKDRGSYAGAFRVEAASLDVHSDLRGAEPSMMHLTIDLSWEPRLSPVGIEHELQALEAIDDQGRPLQAATDGETEALVTPGVMTTELDVPLNVPARSSQKIASLRGKCVALLPGGLETFEFTGLERARGVKQTRGGVHVGLDEVRKNNDLWEIRVRIGYDDTAGALESHRSWIFENEAYLLSPEGQRIPHDGYETTLQSDAEVGVAYLFDVPKGLKDFKFVYTTPAVIVRVPFEYEIQNVPLP